VTKLNKQGRGAVLLAVAVATAIVAIDAALDQSAILTGALVSAPLIAALRAGPRATAGVLGYALLMGLLSGVVNDELGSTDHMTRMLSIVIGGGLGVYVSELRHRGERDAEALRASEARTGSVVEAALDCVVTMDHQGRVTGFNPAAEQTFGYTEQEALGREMAQLIVPPALRDAHRAALRRYVETGQPTILGRRLELTGMRKDGSEFPVELAIARIGPEPPPAFTGYLRDISERLRAQQEREAARDQLEAILSGVADGVTAQAPDGRLLFANQAAVRVLGYDSAEELLAAPLSEVMQRFEVFDERGRPFPLERLPGRRALLGERGAEELLRFRARATGDERWSMVKSTPLVAEDGSVVMAINVFEDITEHKLAERRQQFLAESTGVLAHSLDPDDTLRQVAWLAVPEIADWCAVDLADDDGGLQRVALVHSDPQQLARAEEFQERYPPDPDAPTGVPKVLRTGQSELWPEIPDELLVDGAEDDEHLRLLRELGLRSAMIVPMIARERVIGALTFVNGRSGRLFSGEDLPMAEELARRCAIAIDNSRVYGERDYIARTLQSSLLPAELPLIPGLETAARFRATGEGNEVGGDFYDLFQTGERGWTVVVGDVCGKGPDAAAVTPLARYTVRAAAMRERLPSRVLRLLNEALLRQPGERRFCTVAYAYFEALDDGARLGFASGGHPLPLVLRSHGGVEWLGSHGMLLGAVADPTLDDQSAALSPGDAVIFYTDGVTEAGSPRAALGEERLAEVVAGCAGRDADAIAGSVEAAALEAENGAPRDDIAVVVLRVAPPLHQNGAAGASRVGARVAPTGGPCFESRVEVQNG